jgi:hypothetical protein
MLIRAAHGTGSRTTKLKEPYDRYIIPRELLRGAVQSRDEFLTRVTLEETGLEFDKEVFELALEDASLANNISIASLLLSKRKDLQPMSYTNAVYWAGRKGHTQMLNFLFERIVHEHIELAIDALAGAAFHGVPATQRILTLMGSPNELDAEKSGSALFSVAVEVLLANTSLISSRPMETDDDERERRRVSATKSIIQLINNRPGSPEDIILQSALTCQDGDARQLHGLVSRYNGPLVGGGPDLISAALVSVIHNRPGLLAILLAGPWDCAIPNTDFEKSQSSATCQLMLDFGWKIDEQSGARLAPTPIG